MKTYSILIAAFCLALWSTGCNNQNPGANNQASPAAQKKWRVAFIANNANDYWSIVRLGCDTAVRQLGDVDLNFRSPEDRTAAGQQQILKEVMAEGVDAIAISPVDANLLTESLDAIPTNVMLVCADGDAEKSRRVFYIGTDNVAAGGQAADLLKAALPQGGKTVLFVSHTNAENMSERIEGIQSGLKGSNLQIAEIIEDNSENTMAQKNAEDTLAKYPDLAAMVGLNSYTGPAILLAARSAGKAGKVQIVCFDDDNDTLGGIKTGGIYGTIVQRPFSIGHQTILAIEKYLQRDQSQSTGGKHFISTHVVDKNNVATFEKFQQDYLDQ
jgi:ribose transport system substrate-binding protein